MTLNPETNGVEFSFETTAKGKAVLEDALTLLNNTIEPNQLENSGSTCSRNRTSGHAVAPNQHGLLSGHTAQKEGMRVRDTECELEDPFFTLWIRCSIEQTAVRVPPAQVS